MLTSYDDVVDRDVDELDKKSDESHYGESDSGGHGNFLKLFSVGLGASFYKANWIFRELFQGINVGHNLKRIVELIFW